MKKEIVFVMGTMTPGNGVAVSLINLLNILDYSKYNVSIILITREKGISTEIPKCCKVYRVHRQYTRDFKKQYNKVLFKLRGVIEKNKKNTLIRKIIRIIKVIENRLFYRYVASLFKHQKFDIAIGYSISTSSYIAALLDAELHYSWYHDGNVREISGDEFYYKVSDKIIAVSEEIKEKLNIKRNIPLNKIEVIHNIINFDRIQKNIIYDNCEKNDMNTFVTVARISEEKGILEAILAASIIKNKRSDFVWKFIGGIKSESYYSKCLNLVEKLDLRENIVFKGYQENPFSFIQECDIYVQPSLKEAFGNTILEAMFLKKAVISTKTSGGKELIEDRTTGILCDNNPESLAEAIIELMENDALKNKIISQLSKNAFNNDKTIRKIEELLEGRL